jgi:tetratricopeptide (TPR) repeat protein
MFNIFSKQSLLLMIIISFLCQPLIPQASQSRIPSDTILAEYSEGTITKADFDEELNKIPPIFRARYSSLQGRKEFLHSIVYNRISYLKALELGIDRKPETFEDYEKALKPYYAAFYREEKAKDNKDEVIEQLKEKHGVEINHQSLRGLNLAHLTPTNPQIPHVVVTANDPSLEVTVGELYAHYQGLSPYITSDDITSDVQYYGQFRQLGRDEFYELIDYKTLMRLVNNIVEVNLFDYEARNMLEEEEYHYDPDTGLHSISEPYRSIFDHKVFHNQEVQQIRRHTILRNFFQQEVAAQVEPALEEIETYYEENMSADRISAHRSIQLFLFDSRRQTERARERVLKALQDNDEDTILDVIGESLFQRSYGTIPYIFDDPVLPVFGKDEVMHRAVWNTGVGELSDIERNNGGQYFFLKVLDYYPESPFYSFDHVKEYIAEKLMVEGRSRKWNELLSDLMAEYNVVLYPERLRIVLPAHELFELAENSQIRRRYQEAVNYYDMIIEHHKETTDAYNAKFMKAFLLAQELKDNHNAVVILRDLIENNPEGHLSESAKFMIDELENE